VATPLKMFLNALGVILFCIDSSQMCHLPCIESMIRLFWKRSMMRTINQLMKVHIYVWC